MSSILSVFNLKQDILLKISVLGIVLSSITGGIQLSQPFYYASLALIAIVFFLRGHLQMTNLWVLLLLVACFLSLALNNPPSYFRAWDRLAVYSMVLIVASPMLNSEGATLARYRTLSYFMDISIILSVGSFFAYFLGINLFERQGEMLDINAGTFSGLMNHSMALAPISALSAITIFSRLLNLNKQWTSKIRYFLLIAIMITCCGACLLAASRIALGGLVAGLTIVIVRVFKHRVSKTMGVIALLIIIGGATFPIWGGLTSFVMAKQESNLDNGSAFYSREERFSARIYEFKSSPVIGIGFCVADPRFLGVDETTGRIEPGSSWLAILSMTGILGLMCFLPICFDAMKRVWRIRDSLISSMLSGFLCFLFIHMITEGYIYAPKSCYSLLFWLVISSIYGISLYEEDACNKSSEFFIE